MDDQALLEGIVVFSDEDDPEKHQEKHYVTFVWSDCLMGFTKLTSVQLFFFPSNKSFTVVPVPEVVCVTDGVDGEVVDDTSGGHIRVSLRVNVGVTFPGLPGSELCKTRTQKQLAAFKANHWRPIVNLKNASTWGPSDSVSVGWGGVGTGRPTIAHRAH